jgi:hypothetical protein
MGHVGWRFTGKRSDRLPSVKILPRTESPALRWTVIGLATFCALAAALDFRNGYGGDHADWAWAIIFWLPLGIGLWALQPWARWIALMLLWPLAFNFVGIPFAQMDYTTTEPPDAWLMAAWLAPWSVFSLFSIHVLGKYKKEFRWSQPVDDSD